MEKQPFKLTKVILYALAAIGLLVSIGEIVDWIRGDDFDLIYNPRHAHNGIDTVYSKDSVYIINVGIKEVREQKPEGENPYRDY